MMASVSFDPEYKILYFKFSYSKAIKAIPLTQNIHLDVDKTGRAVGMEIMLPDSIPGEATKAILRLKEKKYLTKQQKLALINSVVLNNLVPIEHSIGPLTAR